MVTAQDIKKSLQSYAKKDKAEILSRFFKTGKGQYGEGDKFIGVMVPDQRKTTKEFHDQLSLEEVKNLLSSEIHEYRLTALLILVAKYESLKKKTDPNSAKKRKEIFDFYLKHTKKINNWDLVDLTAPKIVGDYLIDNPGEALLIKLSDSKNLWEKRIAILATFAFIRNNNLKMTYFLAEKYLSEDHDLMHKATGWMLREAGKKDRKKLVSFLDKHIRKMPRTMLRYAIEKFPEPERKAWLKK